MNKLDINEIDFTGYNEVLPEIYARYYEQDTMTIRVGAYSPHFFVKKDAIGTKEKMKHELETLYKISRDKICFLVSQETCSREAIRQEIEKMFNLKKNYHQVYFPPLDEIIKDLIPLKESLNGHD